MRVVFNKTTLDILYFDSLSLHDIEDGEGEIRVGVKPDDLDNYTVVKQENDQDGLVRYKLSRKSDSDITTQVNNNKWELVRQERAKLLSKTDWTQSNDSPLTDAKKTEWATYRQSLRDVTDQPDPFNITWPTEPN